MAWRRKFLRRRYWKSLWLSSLSLLIARDIFPILDWFKSQETVGPPEEGRRLPIKVHLAGHLGNYTKNRIKVEIPQASDVLDLLTRLDAMFPSVRGRILDEHDKTRPYVNIFVNEENIRDLQCELTTVKEGDDVYILPSVAGGRGMQTSGGTEEEKERG
jgi:molybdopterin synthase sulfur carrier subunit